MKITDLNWFDWILVAIVLVSMGMAFRRGLVRAILGLVGFAGGFALATLTYTHFAEWLMNHHVTLSVASVRTLAFLLIVVGTAAGFELLGWRLQRVLIRVGLSGLDRILGVAFGFGRGCLIGLALLLAAANYAPRSDALTNSVLSPYLFAIAHDVSFLVPQYLQGLMMYGASNFSPSTSH